MAKSKEGKESEFLRGQMRKLKSENRNLKKRLRSLEKREHQYEDREEEYMEETLEIIDKLRSKCPKCHYNTVEEIEIVGRRVDKCINEDCDYRSAAKK